MVTVKMKINDNTSVMYTKF